MNFKEITSRCTKHIATKGLNTIRNKHVLKYNLTAEIITVRGAHDGKLEKFIKRWQHPGWCWEPFCSNHNV